MISSAVWSSPGEVFVTDACLTGGGGLCNDQYFHFAFPAVILAHSLDINCLELLTIVVALQLWGRRWSGYSAGTYSNLRTQFRAFLLFCTHFCLTPVPAQLDTICLYVQFLSRTLCPATIRNYLSGVKLFHLFMGADYPFTKDFILSLTLRGVARSALHTPSGAPPVTPGILLQLFHRSSSQEPISCTLFCAFLFAFFLMARLANIVPESQAKFDPKRHLTRGDVVADAHGLLVTFKATKTIQFGERKLRIPLIRIPGSPLCPVRVYLRMVRLMPAPAKSALFLLPKHRGVQLLTKRRLISEFRRSLQAAGVPNAQGFRGHSFRRGAASWAFNQGVPGELIQLYGDWSSDAYKLYLEFSHEAKLVLAHQFRQAILSL